MSVFEKISNQCGFFLKALYCCQLLGYCYKVNKACFKGFFSRRANLLSFLMKRDNSENTVSAVKSLKRTICRWPRKTLAHSIPYWLVWIEILCTVHVVLPKSPKNGLNQCRKSSTKSLLS